MNLKFFIEKVKTYLKRGANSINIFKDFIKKLPDGEEEPAKIEHPTVIEEIKEEIVVEDSHKIEPKVEVVTIIETTVPEDKQIINEAPRRIKRETKRSSTPKKGTTSNTRRSRSRKNQDGNI